MTRATLFAPAAFWRLTPAQRAALCNGCGARRGLPVPGTIWGLDISIACDIHDYMYMGGETEADREEADRAFLNNLLRIIEADSIPFGPLKWLRRYRAVTYYAAVRDFGGPAFWDSKNKPGEMQIPAG